MDFNKDKVNMFQQQLDNDKDLKASFVQAENSETDSESESDACRIILPKKHKKNKNNNNELLYQLIKQHKVLSKTQKKMYEIQSELDKEEVINRYIKLDLNNSQVQCEELKNNLEEREGKLFNSQVENWVHRVVSAMFFLYHLYYFLTEFLL